MKMRKRESHRKGDVRVLGKAFGNQLFRKI
jgi:hypothetical protein